MQAAQVKVEPQKTCRYGKERIFGKFVIKWMMKGTVLGKSTGKEYNREKEKDIKDLKQFFNSFQKDRTYSQQYKQNCEYISNYFWFLVLIQEAKTVYTVI